MRNKNILDPFISDFCFVVIDLKKDLENEILIKYILS